MCSRVWVDSLVTARTARFFIMNGVTNRVKELYSTRDGWKWFTHAQSADQEIAACSCTLQEPWPSHYLDPPLPLLILLSLCSQLQFLNFGLFNFKGKPCQNNSCPYLVLLCLSPKCHSFYSAIFQLFYRVWTSWWTTCSPNNVAICCLEMLR